MSRGTASSQTKKITDPVNDPGPYLMRVRAPEWIEALRIDLAENEELMQLMERFAALLEGSDYYVCCHTGNHCLYLEDGEGFEILIAPTDPRRPESFYQAVEMFEHVLNTWLLPREKQVQVARVPA